MSSDVKIEKLVDEREKLIEQRTQIANALQEGSQKIQDMQAQLQQLNGAIYALNQFIPEEDRKTEDGLEVVQAEPENEWTTILTCANTAQTILTRDAKHDADTPASDLACEGLPNRVGRPALGP